MMKRIVKYNSQRDIDFSNTIRPHVLVQRELEDSFIELSLFVRSSYSLCAVMSVSGALYADSCPNLTRAMRLIKGGIFFAIGAFIFSSSDNPTFSLLTPEG
jgi:hypothetical protein